MSNKLPNFRFVHLAGPSCMTAPPEGQVWTSFSIRKCIRTCSRRNASAWRSPLSVSAGNHVFIPRITISCSRNRAASSLAWSDSVGRGGGMRAAATARAPSEKLLQLAGNAIAHALSLIIARSHTSSRASA
jgi:hypothetical protein